MAEATSILSGLPIIGQEEVQVAVYEEGGKFDLHYDACDATPEVCHEFNRGRGQRKATLLVYLTDSFDGGETCFPHMDPPQCVKPETGTAVFFLSTGQDGKLIRESMHLASQVTNGKKWIATKWAHEGPF
jgi:prolyl 4-hydroxylase